MANHSHSFLEAFVIIAIVLSIAALVTSLVLLTNCRSSNVVIVDSQAHFTGSITESNYVLTTIPCAFTLPHITRESTIRIKWNSGGSLIPHSGDTIDESSSIIENIAPGTSYTLIGKPNYGWYSFNH